MAQSEPPPPELSSSNADGRIPHKFWRKLLGRNNVPSDPIPEPPKPQDPSADDEIRPELIRRVPREVVPGLPRAKTFKRQQSELRENLEPVQPTPAERRALSMDRRWHASQTSSQCPSNPRTSAPDMVDRSISETSSVPSLPASPVEDRMLDSVDEMASLSEIQMQVPTTEYRSLSPTNPPSLPDDASMTTSQYDQMIHDELEQRWILNLSMHFRDRTKREKFFVTFRQDNAHWRRVTISLDYRNAPEDSLEMDLFHTKHQRDKNAKIYEAIRESLEDIQFYETVTNLKLQTTDGRLHVHVVEDVNEVIEHPNVNMVKHLGCPRIREKDIEFDSHMSGFVYKVRVDGRLLIKKEIPGQDTVDEFLYEVNALHHLRDSPNVIEFFGVVVDDKEEKIKGLLISYADQGALIDIIYDHDHTLPWVTREKWARQVVQGLSHIHEAGFVQGDFTLSNIVIDSDENARIIDINRRGCPVGWEPPEATPLIDTGQRISMYIGVKSDLFQLGMVLWALAAQEDEPESSGRPLTFDEDLRQTTPEWYQRIVQICLNPDPRRRIHATDLLRLFPVYSTKTEGHGAADKKNGHIIRTGQPPSSWQFDPHYYVNPDLGDQTYAYPPRGRSPPSPLPSNHDGDRPYWSRGYSYGGGHSTSASSVPESMPQEYVPSEKASKFVESREISADAVVHEAGTTGPQGKAFLEHNDETPRVEKEGLDIGSAGGDTALPPESAHASSEEERPAEQSGSNDAKEKMIVPEVRVDTAPSDLSESHVDEDEVKPTSSPRAASWHIEDQQRDTVSSTGAEPGSTGPGPSEDDGDEKIQDQSERWEEAHPQEHAGDIQMKHSASSDKDGSSSRSKLDKVTTDTLFESSDPPPVGPGSEAARRSPAAATGGTVAEDLQGIGSAHESSAGGDESPTAHETMEHDLGLLTTTHQPTDHEAT